MFTFNPKSYAPREVKAFKQAVIARLQQTEDDAAIDNRSIESVAWMADELHRRIDWYFNAKQYVNSASIDDAEAETMKTTVSVFQGRVTASARRAAGIEGKIHFIGQQSKTRLDRRHHAVDASVIAMMNTAAAQTLMERESLRESQRLIGLMPGERSWKEYPYEGTSRYESFHLWLDNMDVLLELLNDALDNDRIAVMQSQRYVLGNSIAHDATIHPLEKVPLGSAMSADLIRRASTPALWCALTRLPDYDEKEGLPEDSHREIRVHDTRYSADDEMGFFASQAAQIAVQEGSADIGSAIHHARVYRCWKTNAKGVRKYFYGMIRVFQTVCYALAMMIYLPCRCPRSLFRCGMASLGWCRRCKAVMLSTWGRWLSVMKSRWIFPVSMLMVRLASIYNSSRSLVEGTLHGNIGLLMDSLTRRS